MLIKFRAWDELNKVMHYDFEFITSGDGENDWIIFKSDKQRLQDKKVFDNPYMRQQFKIMPGIEIDGKWCFEGDICFVYSDFYGDEVKRKAIIKQIRNSFCFDYIDSCFTVSDWSQYHKIEIIGNKWDNPDTDNK